jgi:hypothetical protein
MLAVFVGCCDELFDIYVMGQSVMMMGTQLRAETETGMPNDVNLVHFWVRWYFTLSLACKNDALSVNKKTNQ